MKRSLEEAPSAQLGSIEANNNEGGGRQGLAGRALMLFASRVAVLGMNFVASILVARGLGPAGRGTYALAVLVPVLVAQIVSLGLNMAAVYFTGKKSYSPKQIASTLFWLALVIGSGSAIIAGWMLGVWNRTFGGDLPLSLLWMTLVTLPLLIWIDWLGHMLLGEERTTAFALLAVIQSITLLIAQGLGFLRARGQIEVFIGGWLLSQFVAALGAILMVGKRASLRFSIHWGFLREAVRYSRTVYVANWLQFLSFRVDQLFVYTWLGSAALGQYAIAVSLAEALWQLPTSVGAVLFARVATDQEQSEPATTARVCRLTLLATLGLVLLMAGTAPVVVPLLFGEEYRASLLALYALFPGTVAIVLPRVIGGSLYGRRMPKYITYGAGITLIATIVGDVLLIPSYGISGAGLASSLSYVIFGIFMVAVATNKLGEPWLHFILPPRVGGRHQRLDYSQGDK